jgi:hypothetical protein
MQKGFNFNKLPEVAIEKADHPMDNAEEESKE